jgi:hypothetical protein
MVVLVLEKKAYSYIMVLELGAVSVIYGTALEIM